MKKKGLFFDMMLAVMVPLGIMTVIVGLYSTATAPDVYEDFSLNYTFSSEYASMLLEVQTVQKMQLSTIQIDTLSNECDEYAQDINTGEHCYKKIVSRFFESVDISDLVTDMNFTYVLSGNNLEVRGIQPVQFEYNTPRANISLEKPIRFSALLDDDVVNYMQRVIMLEELFIEAHRCMLLSTACSPASITVQRSIYDINQFLVETIFTDKITGLQARSLDTVSEDVLLFLQT